MTFQECATVRDYLNTARITPADTGETWITSRLRANVNELEQWFEIQYLGKYDDDSETFVGCWRVVLVSAESSVGGGLFTYHELDQKRGSPIRLHAPTARIGVAVR